MKKYKLLFDIHAKEVAKVGILYKNNKKKLTTYSSFKLILKQTRFFTYLLFSIILNYSQFNYEGGGVILFSFFWNVKQ